jgi:hypothetical protein
MDSPKKKLPNFAEKSPVLSFSALDMVAEEALGWIDVQGGDVERNGGRTTIRFPEIEEQFFVKVFLENLPCVADQYGDSAAGLGIATDSDSSNDRVVYSWKKVRPIECGLWEEVPPPFDVSGDGLYTPLYEDNNAIVPDGSIQRISKRITWYDVPSKKWVHEYRFAASSGQSGDGLIVDLVTCSSLLSAGDNAYSG